MAEFAHYKNYLYAWCGKQSIKPEYLFESEGDPHQLTFYCEVCGHKSGILYILYSVMPRGCTVCHMQTQASFSSRENCEVFEL